MTTLVMAALAFLSGALPLSVWIGRYGLGVDIHEYGDGNPGAFNVLRAGGVAWGGLAIFMDVFKAALPVGLATYVFEFTDLSLVLIAVMPVYGHAFSPFLDFKGGKSIAAAGGTLIGISLGELSIIAIILLVIWYLTLTSSGWAVMFTIAGLLFYMLLSGSPATWFGVVLGMTALLIYKHREELTHPPRFKVTHP